MASVNEIRRQFLEFFRSRGHETPPSAPLVPQDDPTLLFVNAGMVPFKNYFTGPRRRHSRAPPPARSACAARQAQRPRQCRLHRASPHLLRNAAATFRFGDYFKEAAIDNAWTLLTKEFGLAKDKLTITIYHDDDEAHGLWKKIAGLSDDKIIRIDTNDNFWSMGDTGPCGPCSEIFYDHGDKIFGGPPGSADADGDRFVEIWNLVFMQFEQFNDGRARIPLPKPSIDTGARPRTCRRRDAGRAFEL